MTQRDPLKNLLLPRYLPGDIALPPDDPIFGHRRNQRDFHLPAPFLVLQVSLLSKITYSTHTQFQLSPLAG
jgi:hypothetical protein